MNGIYGAILESGMGCKSCLSVDREISRGKRVKRVNLFELDEARTFRYPLYPVCETSIRFRGRWKS